MGNTDNFFDFVALAFTTSKAVQGQFLASLLSSIIVSRNWTAGKAMYLLTRYSGAAFLIIVLLSDIGLGWNFVGGMEAQHSPQFCFGGLIYTGPGTFIILNAEIILQMRVYALYGRTKKVLALLVFLSLTSLAVIIIQLLGFAREVMGGICTTDDCRTKYSVFMEPAAFLPYLCSASSAPMSGIGWLKISLLESILFVMVLIKARRAKGSLNTLPSNVEIGLKQRTRGITAVMAQDSLTYFAIIFTACLVGTCLSFVSQVRFSLNSRTAFFIYSQLNAYQTVVVAIMTILAPNLLIRLRKEYYGPMETQASNTLTWNTAVPVSGLAPDSTGERTEN
ncbi:hypothetical protein M0805_002072 [Coniferiporia weirii]|nr:hypothetical protein M0805_002072 [Coniferiporia weirii]